MVRAGSQGEDEQVGLEQQLAVVGFYGVPDLSGATSRDAVASICRKALADAREAQVERLVRQLHTFANEISIGDVIVLPLKSAQKVMLGVVKGPYEYRTDLGKVRHTRKVEWSRAIPRTDIGQDLRYSLRALMTVCRIKRNDADARFAALLKGEVDPGAAAIALRP